MYKARITKLFTLLLTAGSVMCQTALASDTSIRIYAASSLTNVLNQLISNYENEHKIDIVAIYGGSSSLARQIERGAPADLFISANELWVNHLEKQGIVGAENISTFTHNQLVVVAPVSSEAQLKADQTDSWLETLGDSRLAIGQPNAVPAGIYAKQALQSMGLWRDLSSHLAPTNNVRVALTLVERAEAPLGIVYNSDAVVSDKVKIVHTFAATTHEPIRYPLVRLNDSTAAEQFVHYLSSDAARQALIKYGFN